MREKSFAPPRIRNLIGFSSLIMLIFCMIVAYQGAQAYRQALQDGQQSAGRLTRILSDHVELSFLAVDLTLRRAVERQYFNTLFGNNLPEYTKHNFGIWLDETPQIAVLMQVNEQGLVEVVSYKAQYERWRDYAQSMAGELVFEHLRGADDQDIFVGKLAGHPHSLIVVGRRYNKLNGDFGGMVMAAMDPDYFQEFYKSIAFGVQKTMSILLPDYTVLASGPYLGGDNGAFTRAILEEKLDPAALHQGYTTMRAAEDGLRIVSIRQMRHLPILVSVLLHEEDFLYSWRQSRLKDIGFLALFTTFALVLSLFAIAMARQIMRVEESEAGAILASQAKSEFLANMSHELRTPLNAIIGFSEMINSGYFGPLNAKQKERIHDIHLCGSHLLQLITDILEFSKGDAGKLELVEEKFDMSEIIGEGVRMLSGKVKTKGIHLVVATEPDLPPMWGDKRKIRQILLNLLSNAIKFTPEDGTIKVAVKRDQNNAVQLLVSDTGVGIAEEDIPTALSVFGQVHRGKSHEGTGLGLPLCKMYAELHGGKLSLTSKPGEGTTVRVIFPHQRTLLVKKE